MKTLPFFVTLALVVCAAAGAVATNAPPTLADRAGKGEVEAQRELGQAYLNGTGMPRDERAGVEWLTSAANNGDGQAHFLLAMYFEQQPKTTTNREQAVLHYRRAAEQGHTTAQARVGEILIERAEDPALSASDKDAMREKGLTLIKFAASKSNGYAAYRLADMQWEGRNLARDARAAIENYRVAAANGQPSAAYKLAWYYLHDAQGQAQGGNAEGVKYLKLAGDGYIADAIMELAKRYENGEGVERDYAEAEHWAKRGQEIGAADAAAALARITSAKRAEELKLAQEQKAAEAARVAQERKAADDAKAAEEAKLAEARAMEAKRLAEQKKADDARKPSAPDNVLAFSGTEATTYPAPSAKPTASAPLAAVPPPPASPTPSASLMDRLAQLETQVKQLISQQEPLRQALADRDARIKSLEGERDAAIAAQRSAEETFASIEKSLATGRAQLAVAASSRSSSPSKPLAPIPAALAIAAPASSPEPTPTPAPQRQVVVSEQATKLNDEALRTLAERRYPEAIDLFTQAATYGHAGAFNNLGMIHMRGLGVAPNMDKAVYYFEQSANRGNATAANNLGQIYGRGIGVPTDQAKSTAWYRKAQEISGDAKRVAANTTTTFLNVAQVQRADRGN